MKIIHIADVHLDSKMDGFPYEFAKKRREEILCLFEEAIFFAKNNDVRVCIIAGDLFDTEKVFEKTKKRLYNLFKENEGIDFLILKGNHDKIDFIRELSEQLKNVKEFSSEWINYNYGNVNICGVNGLKEINYNDLELPFDAFNIAVMHGQVVDYKTSDNRLISLANLRHKNLDYVALGHLHNYQKIKLDERGEVCYSGCLEGRGFDEVGKKGFILIDTDDYKNRFTFIPFSKREIFVLEFKYLGEDFTEFSSKIIENIANLNNKNMIVKIVLKGDSSEPIFIDFDYLKNKIEQYVLFAQIDNEIKFIPNLDSFNNCASLKDEFISLVLKSDMENLTKSDVIMCGINALLGEDF